MIFFKFYLQSRERYPVSQPVQYTWSRAAHTYPFTLLGVEPVLLLLPPVNRNRTIYRIVFLFSLPNKTYFSKEAST